GRLAGSSKHCHRLRGEAMSADSAHGLGALLVLLVGVWWLRPRGGHFRIFSPGRYAAYAFCAVQCGELAASVLYDPHFGHADGDAPTRLAFLAHNAGALQMLTLTMLMMTLVACLPQADRLVLPLLAAGLA